MVCDAECVLFFWFLGCGGPLLLAALGGLGGSLMRWRCDGVEDWKRVVLILGQMVGVGGTRRRGAQGLAGIFTVSLAPYRYADDTGVI